LSISNEHLLIFLQILLNRVSGRFFNPEGMKILQPNENEKSVKPRRGDIVNLSIQINIFRCIQFQISEENQGIHL
jgi:hypothetical protein